MVLMGGARRVLQWNLQWETKSKVCVDPKKVPWLGLSSATRTHELGMASNRGSAYHGETVPNPCTYRPSHAENFGESK